MEQIQTGIAGFDELFLGGILTGSTVLVEGIPGAGKTTMGLEFLYRGARDFGEPGLVLTFEQFPASLYRDALNFGWNIRELEKVDKLRIICTSPEVALLPESDFLEETVRKIGARRILVDSMSHFRQVVADPLQLRQGVYAFCNGLRRLGLTSFLIQEQEHDSEDLHSFEEFLVDVVVRLSYDARNGLQRSRAVEILKSRGQPHLSGKHSLKITSDGIKVFSLHTYAADSPSPGYSNRTPLKTGIRGLDELLQGGIPRGASVVVAGEAGTGKTVLGLEFLVKGACLYQEKGLFVSLEESPEEITGHAASFNWDLEGLISRGMVLINYQPLVDVEVSEFICSLGSIIGLHQIRRVVIDSLPDLIARVRDQAQLREKFFYMLRYLHHLGCTTLLLYPRGGEIAEQQLGIVLSLAHGNILLRSLLVHNRRIRHLEIYKMRGVSHITGNHLMEITNTGIQVFPRVGGVG